MKKAFILLFIGLSSCLSGTQTRLGKSIGVISGVSSQTDRNLKVSFVATIIDTSGKVCVFNIENVVSFRLNDTVSYILYRTQGNGNGSNDYYYVDSVQKI